MIFYYTVKPGDTLEEIAAKFGATVEAILQANDLELDDLIQPGDVLAIPVTPEETNADDGGADGRGGGSRPGNAPARESGRGGQGR